MAELMDSDSLLRVMSLIKIRIVQHVSPVGRNSGLAPLLLLQDGAQLSLLGPHDGYSAVIRRDAGRRWRTLPFERSDAEGHVESGRRNGCRCSDHVEFALRMSVRVDAGQTVVFLVNDGHLLLTDGADGARSPQATGVALFNFGRTAWLGRVITGQSVWLLRSDNESLVGSRIAGRMSPRDLQSVDHGQLERWVRHFRDHRTRSRGQGAPTADQFDIALLQTVIRARNAEQHQGQEQQRADDEQNLQFAQPFRFGYKWRLVSNQTAKSNSIQSICFQENTKCKWVKRLSLNLMNFIYK